MRIGSVTTDARRSADRAAKLVGAVVEGVVG